MSFVCFSGDVVDPFLSAHSPVSLDETFCACPERGRPGSFAEVALSGAEADASGVEEGLLSISRVNFFFSVLAATAMSRSDSSVM